MSVDVDSELLEIEASRASGDHPAAHARAIALAREYPADVRVAMAAAYACDRIGLERDAIVHYERAWQLGVPAADRPGFLVGFGSTLRNVGRAEDAVARLAEATTEYPDDPSLRAFLSLALHSAGHSTLALATMLEAALAAADRAEGFGRFTRALVEYQKELVDAALEARR